MRKIMFLVGVLAASALATTSCRMAPNQDPGDTVEARVFEPIDTTGRAAKLRHDTAAIVRDSADIYYIGTGSTATEVQLVSYPSRRDTAVYAKGRHLQVRGSADYGRVVRARLWTSAGGDTLVTELEEIKTQTEAHS